MKFVYYIMSQLDVSAPSFSGIKKLQLPGFVEPAKVMTSLIAR